MFFFEAAAGSSSGESDQTSPMPGAGGDQKLLVVPFGKYIDMYRRRGAALAATALLGASASSHGRLSATVALFSMARRETGGRRAFAFIIVSIPAEAKAEGIAHDDVL